MLSYRHAFHAGNHADVLKHLVLVQICRYLGQKDTAFCYIDTHAGAGGYDLGSDQAQKLGEFRDGIGRLWQRSDLPAAVGDYLALVREFNAGERLVRYPGSPWLANALLRGIDRLRLFEMHSTDFRLLGKLFKNAGKRITLTAGDGFAGLKALLPPLPRRGFVLIDPSYETRSDYSAVVQALEEGCKRFATGTYALWYPRLARAESRQLPHKLKTLATSDWLHAALDVRKPAGDGIGMHGSGLFVINPPWTLRETLGVVLPWLVDVLAQDGQGGYVLETSADQTPIFGHRRGKEA